MNKIQALILLLFSLLIGLGQAGNITASVLSGKLQLPKLAIAIVIFLLCIAGVVKSVKMLKGGSNVVVEPPATSGKKIIYQLGNVFLVLAGLAAAYTVGLIIYLSLTKTTGVPAGFGLAAAMILFVMGQGLKGLVQATHNKAVNSQPTAGNGRS